VADRVVHLEITADDPERAAEFYRRTFGGKITNWGGAIDTEGNVFGITEPQRDRT
jgi:catechol 2,3-dioxygenase-like lactoylglutathione lyase family enzyme